ncbi:MAG: hypothetical protein ACTS8S_18530, partial [Giesbergeria sp.]
QLRRIDRNFVVDVPVGDRVENTPAHYPALDSLKSDAGDAPMGVGTAWHIGTRKLHYFESTVADATRYRHEQELMANW